MDAIKGSEFIANTYNRFPVSIKRGQGVHVWDENGKSYIDLTSGIAVCNLGHCHPDVIQAVTQQIQELFHISNLYWTTPQIKVAEILVKKSCTDQVFFCNSGAEAVEAAIKLARKYGHDTKGPDCYEIICLQGSFHGRTLAAITATGQPVFQRGFEPLPSGFVHVPPNDIKALELAVTDRSAAILLEPIQGEGGVRPLTQEYLKAARDIATQKGLLLIFDEIQVGMGRTGTLFAYEQTGTEPDVICLAKALANGLPLGAMLAKKQFMTHLGPGTHASTFGGNPVACSAALEVLRILTQTDLLQQVINKGDYLRQLLLGFKDRCPKVKDVRGRGLIQAIEFWEPEPDLAMFLMEQGFLTIVANGKLLRLLPPLIIEKEHLDRFIQVLDGYFEKNKK